MTVQDHYAVLHIPRTANYDEVKSAYRKLALINHPDKGGNAAAFVAVQVAYEILRDPTARARYDRLLPQASTHRRSHSTTPGGSPHKTDTRGPQDSVWTIFRDPTYRTFSQQSATPRPPFDRYHRPFASETSAHMQPNLTTVRRLADIAKVHEIRADMILQNLVTPGFGLPFVPELRHDLEQFQAVLARRTRSLGAKMEEMETAHSRSTGPTVRTSGLGGWTVDALKEQVRCDQETLDEVETRVGKIVQAMQELNQRKSSSETCPMDVDDDHELRQAEDVVYALRAFLTWAVAIQLQHDKFHCA